MLDCKKLSLADVKTIGAAAEAEAVRRGLAVSIAICDEGGHLLWFQRMDRVALLTVGIVVAKARTAALGKRPTKVFQQMIDSTMPSLAAAPAMEGALEGGVPIIAAGEVVGGIAASGGSGEDDAAIAQAGAAALLA